MFQYSEPIYCPGCQRELTHGTNLEDETLVPRPGDFWVCIDCGELAVFDEGLRPRMPTDEEKREIYAGPEGQTIIRHQIAIGFLRAAKQTGREIAKIIRTPKPPNPEQN